MKPDTPPHDADRSPLGVAFVWGLAESTCFFLVPDVWTSRLALRELPPALWACLASVAGALLGGTLLYLLGQNPATAAALRGAFDYIPGVTPALIESARDALDRQGAQALFTGMASGIPYKLYALPAPAAGLGFGAFLAVSAAARLLRFLIVTSFSWLVARSLLGRFDLLIRRRVHAACWLLFYALYFRTMGW